MTDKVSMMQPPNHSYCDVHDIRYGCTAPEWPDCSYQTGPTCSGCDGGGEKILTPTNQPDDLDPMVKLKQMALDLVNAAKEAQVEAVVLLDHPEVDKSFLTCRDNLGMPGVIHILESWKAHLLGFIGGVRE